MKNYKPTVFALAGPIAAGKSTASSILKDQFDFKIIRTRDVLGDLITSQGEVINDQSLQQFGATIMDGSGAEAFCKIIANSIDPDQSYVIDSVRPVSHYEWLLNLCHNFHLIYLHASLDNRKEHYITRRGDRESSVNGFIERTTHPVEQEVQRLFDYADAVIINNHDLKTFERRLFACVIPFIYPEPVLYFQQMVQAVVAFHNKHGYDVDSGNREIMPLRISLMIEELGEISQCISKGKGNIEEEHADLLYLLLGNAITLGFDLEEAFWKKHDINMQREARKIGDRIRVSDWNNDG
jgi:dephospho-CoA kinase